MNDTHAKRIELIKSDKRYLMPQKDVSNCSSSQIEESETVSPYCSNDEQKYDFETDAVDEKDDDDYVPEPISDVSDEGFEKVKGSPHRNLIKNAEFDLKKTKMCIFVIMMVLPSLEEVLQRWILALWCTTMKFSSITQDF